jgi:transcriptional regulator GlxA family with amidase domain
MEEMQQRFGQVIVLDDLAAAVRLSRSRFSHLFREQTGVAPWRYLRDLRLQRARVLLETTPLSVKEVMALVGVNDPSHFSRDFCAAFGASPRAWRKRSERPMPDAVSAPGGDRHAMARLEQEQAADAARAHSSRTSEGGRD